MIFKFRRFLLQRRLAFLAVVLFLFAGAYGLILHEYEFPLPIVFFESGIFLFLFLVFSLILYRIYYFYHSKTAISLLNLSTILCFSALYVFLTDQYGNWLFPKAQHYAQFLNQAHLLRGMFSFLLLLAFINQFWIDKHILDLEKRNRNFLEQEKRIIQVELQNLKQQFQPHFLFNSLNSINALIGSKPDEARKMILLLSDFLRLSIKKKENDTTPLNEELKFLELYLEIEKVRFGHRLNIQFEIDESLNEQQVPTQVLQPLLENAIKYGLYQNIGELLISVRVSNDQDFIRLEISNPKDETLAGSTTGTGFGLRSVRQKLNLIYRRNDLLEIQETAHQFTVIIRIPITEAS